MDILYFVLFFMQRFFLGFPCSFGFPAGYRRSFGDRSIRFSTRSSTVCFDLITISSLAMSTGWVFKAHILKYLVVLVYLLNILFQVLCISDLKRFSDGIFILTLLPNSWMCLRFCLTSDWVSAGMMIVLSTICFVGNRFYR